MVSIATSTLAQRVFTFFFFFNFFIIIYEGDTEDTYRSLYKLIFCPKPHKATFCTPRVSKLTITADNTNGENSASDKTNCICWLGRSHAELFISQEPVWKVLRICLFVWFLLGEAPENALNKLKCPHCNYIAKHRRTLKRHLIIHSGVRSFSCDICGKLFTRREHVKRHSLVREKHKCL